MRLVVAAIAITIVIDAAGIFPDVNLFTVSANGKYNRKPRVLAKQIREQGGLVTVSRS